VEPAAWLNLQKQRCWGVCSVEFEKAAAAAAKAVLNLKKQHCCGKSSLGFEKLALLRQMQR